MKMLRLVFGDIGLVIITVFASFMGVGQISAQAGLDAPQTAIMTLLSVASPAQAAAMQILADGGFWVAAIVTMIVVNLRFIVMSASILGRLPAGRGWSNVSAIGLISASSFAVILSRLMGNAPRRPALYASLVCLFCATAATLGAIAGQQLAASVPSAIGAVLGAIIPVYFATLLARLWIYRGLMIHALAGALLIPPAYSVIGSVSLLVMPLAAAAIHAMVEHRGGRSDD
ncbi:AzlC family ABC transporter permease [Consotaella salsifontis]|uniref:Predicted branched-chain amino acid permease (Azaleucine resistance) n=1 Tax=Consotaella salsifontis TaxID=1365950 RepID=A0A1T4L3U6_9HYPH|nr:AzlC family ABC transporter permease [Consotaella salsifontis]SJZ49227.1 Predicted branched-chain amino acid permease (azaleucine resistance) [Consotaella salsifontis]